VADGAVAIEALGDAIDSTVATALGGAYPGLRLVKKQTIGSAVSSVAVTGAFSATYENYLIVVNGGIGSTTSSLRLQVGSATSGYYSAGVLVNYGSGSSSTVINTGASFTQAGTSSAAAIQARIELQNPFLTKATVYSSDYAVIETTGSSGRVQGFLNDTTSHTGFTVIPVFGTLTGGTIYVYGYGIS
jgi:hypothetical protein